MRQGGLKMAQFRSGSLAGFIAGIALTQIASAADLPRKAPPAPLLPPVFNWTGFYVGANIGGGWARDHGDHFCIDPTGVLNPPNCQVLPPGSEHISSSGIIGGGQMGYNWQTGQIVLGIETDFQGSDIHGSTVVGGPFGFAGLPGVALPAGSFTASEKIDWFGTVRGRVGWVVWDRALIFATGGLFYGHIKANSLFTAPNVGTIYSGSSSETRAGWTVGGGVEYAFNNNWSGKIEGLYYDLGSITVVGNETPLTFLPGGFQHNKDFDFKGGIVRVGLNYLFK
jgi:outer membrane immunogenic protein